MHGGKAISVVRRIVDSHPRLPAAKMPMDKTDLERQIDGTDKRDGWHRTNSKYLASPSVSAIHLSFHRALTGIPPWQGRIERGGPEGGTYPDVHRDLCVLSCSPPTNEFVGATRAHRARTFPALVHRIVNSHLCTCLVLDLGGRCLRPTQPFPAIGTRPRRRWVRLKEERIVFNPRGPGRTAPILSIPPMIKFVWKYALSPEGLFRGSGLT